MGGGWTIDTGIPSLVSPVTRGAGTRQICRRSCSTGDRSSPSGDQRPTDQVGI